MSSSPSEAARRRSRSHATASAGDTVATGPSGETSSLFIASTSSADASRKMPTWLPKKSSAPSRSFVRSVSARVVEPGAVLAAEILDLVAAGDAREARVLARDDAVGEHERVRAGPRLVGRAPPDDERLAEELQARLRRQPRRLGRADEQQHRAVLVLAGRERRLDGRERPFGPVRHAAQTITACAARTQ